MLYLYQNNALWDVDSLTEAGGLSELEHPVISVTGAGGKTSTIRRIAEEYVRSGRKVIVITSTHLMAEDKPWFLLEPSEEKLDQILDTYGQVWAGIPGDRGRMKILPDDFLEVIWKKRLPVLIEADGARQMPLKVPGDHEPVILPETTHVLSVYGLDGIGQKIRDVFFRPEKAAELLERQPDDLVRVEDIIRLASSREAGRKGCSGQTVYGVVLNKADDLRRKARGLEIGRGLEQAGIGPVFVSSCISD